MQVEVGCICFCIITVSFLSNISYILSTVMVFYIFFFFAEWVATFSEAQQVGSVSNEEKIFFFQVRNFCLSFSLLLAWSGLWSTFFQTFFWCFCRSGVIPIVSLIVHCVSIPFLYVMLKLDFLDSLPWWRMLYCWGLVSILLCTSIKMWS